MQNGDEVPRYSESRMAVTIPGKNGDALWAMATAQALFEADHWMDLYVMAGQRGLVELFRRQRWVAYVECMDEWVAQGSPHGDVPRVPPQSRMDALRKRGYKQIVHLGYPTHPMTLRQTLVEAHARAVGTPVDCLHIPFIHGPIFRPIVCTWISNVKVVVGFNIDRIAQKEEWLAQVRLHFPAVQFIRLEKIPWDHAACWIATADLFLGDMSALHVLAMAMGKPVAIYEPDDERRTADWVRCGTLRSGSVVPLRGQHSAEKILSLQVERAVVELDGIFREVVR